MIFFTSDEHLGHSRIIEYCNRPFVDVDEMDNTIIERHNSLVGHEDTVYHLGDFTFKNSTNADIYKSRLNGRHIFLKGNHDKDKTLPHIIELKIEEQPLVLCHYAMRVWNLSHYGSWNLHGHSHGMLVPYGLQLDVGVDNNKFYPVSFDTVKEIMATRPHIMNDSHILNKHD